MGGKLGIKETKEAVKFGVAVIKAGKDALADGKVGLGDALALWPLLSGVAEAVQGGAQIPKEHADLDEGEFDELVGEVKGLIADLTPDQYEAIVWAALALVKEILF